VLKVLVMMDRIYEVNSLDAMAEWAKDCAASVKSGDIILLYGAMGVGKTTFCQSFIPAILGENVEVTSPTFTIVNYYDSEHHKGGVWHFDLYRLNDPEEIFETGWDEARQGIVIVEWPERLGAHKPEKALEIHLAFGQGETHRIITVKGMGTQ
jgi:tRNA threonylcarbamoyladenosine biosynthesis protein TsaE